MAICFPSLRSALGNRMKQTLRETRFRPRGIRISENGWPMPTKGY
jgi:hypothetical protein